MELPILLPKWTSIHFVEKGSRSGWWWGGVNEFTDQVQQSLLNNVCYGPKPPCTFSQPKLLYGIITCCRRISFPLESQFSLVGSFFCLRQPISFCLERLKWQQCMPQVLGWSEKLWTLFFFNIFFLLFKFLFLMFKCCVWSCHQNKQT